MVGLVWTASNFYKLVMTTAVSMGQPVCHLGTSMVMESLSVYALRVLLVCLVPHLHIQIVNSYDRMVLMLNIKY